MASSERKKLNNVWLAMRYRCERPNHPSWPGYGGRGITVCDRWSSFEAFLADMGPRPHGYTLERIDNDAGYGPENCKWASPKEQAANKRPRNGREISLKDEAAARGLSADVVRARLRLGWSEERAYSEPAQSSEHIVVTFGGVTYPSLKQACSALSLRYDAVLSRVRAGWDVDRAMTAPLRADRRRDATCSL